LHKPEAFPKFIENSQIPVFLSAISPIEISAISIGLFVFSRGPVTPVTRQHETIHYHQWRELGFVLFPFLYVAFYLRNRIQGLSGKAAYLGIPFEREAYSMQSSEGYLGKRPFLAWLNFL
jgi:hypothetical protein